MIPKIIHYCWFGGNPLPELAQKCIASWKKYCPDYEIREWNETNFDLNYNEYVREAYEVKKWAFVTDVVRLYALVNYGGIYMDTDVELLKPIDHFLEHEAVSGFESQTLVQTALMGCREHFPLFEELLRDYDGLHFIREDGTLDIMPNTDRITQRLLEYGLNLNNELQSVCGLALYPTEYFCPKDSVEGNVHLSENTVCIHHFDGSWMPEDLKEYYRCYNREKNRIEQILPHSTARLLAKFIAISRCYGVSKAVKDTASWVQGGKKK